MTPPDLSPAGLLAFCQESIAQGWAVDSERFAALAAYLRETERAKQAAVDAAYAECERVVAMVTQRYLEPGFVYNEGDVTWATFSIAQEITKARQRAKEGT